MKRWALLLTFAVAVSACADETDDAKAQVAKAEAVLTKMQALKDRGLTTAVEVSEAELSANRARAALARLTGDEKEEQYREAIVKGVAAAVKGMEQLQKTGAVSTDELDRTRRDLAVAKIDLAALRGQQKVIVTELRVIVGIEERRVARVTELYQRGIVTRNELDGYRKTLDKARDMLKQAGGAE